MKKLLLTSAIVLALTGCGSSSTPQNQTTPPVTVTPDPEPTLTEIVQEISSHFVEHLSDNFTRYDFISDTELLVTHSADTSIPTTTLVDFSDRKNITYTDLGETTHYRGLLVADFDTDSMNDVYLFSHGFEIFDDQGELVDSAIHGDNILLTKTDKRSFSGGYTHGACAGDFNGDTYPDIYDVNPYMNSIDQIRINDGNGNFTVNDTAPELSETLENFTSCASADIDGDGYDDVVLGRNTYYSGEHNPNTVLFGSANGLYYDENRSRAEFVEHDNMNDIEAAVAIKLQGEYMVSFVTDYYNSAVELFKWTDSGYVYIEALTLNEQILDVDTIGDEFVPRWSNLNNLKDHFTREVKHYSIVDGSLQVTTKTR